MRVNRVKKYQIRSKKKKICYNLMKTLKQFEGWGIMYNTYTVAYNTIQQLYNSIKNNIIIQ